MGDVTQFQSRAEQEAEQAQESIEREAQVFKHSGIYAPIAAAPGVPVVRYQRKCVDFSFERPIVQVMVDAEASKEEVIAQLRRVIQWLKSNDISLMDIDEPDSPSMYVAGY